MSTWTTAQWGAFTGTAAAGLAALGLLIIALRTIRGWTAPATFAAEGPPRTPRPTLVRAAGRIPAAELGGRMARWAYDISGELRVISDVPVIPGDGPGALPQLQAMIDDVEAHLAEGPGSIATLGRITVDPTLRSEREIKAEDEAWINAYADLSAALPETAAAAEKMRVELEPVLRKTRLWLIRAGETGARAALAEWRMSEHTGEYLSPFSITPRAVAYALLVS